MDRVQWLDDTAGVQKAVLDDLATTAQEWFERISALESGCALVRFFNERANTLLSLEDIAYHLIEPHAVMAGTVDALPKMGLIRCVPVAGVVLFGLTEDPKNRILVHTLCDWQERWRTRAASIERAVQGQARNAPRSTKG